MNGALPKFLTHKLIIHNIYICCFKPLNGRVVCYATIDNWNITFCLEYCNGSCEIQEKALEWQGNGSQELQQEYSPQLVMTDIKNSKVYS